MQTLNIPKLLYLKIKEWCYEKRTVIISKSIKEILKDQFEANGEFNRYDTIVRLLAIENEYGLNDYGWLMYAKMQNARVGKGRDISEQRIIQFRELIHSWEKNGYQKRSYICLGRDGKLIDGSHRLALAIYHKTNEIMCRVVPDIKEISYGRDWFVKNSFSQQEIDYVEKKISQLKLK